MSPTGTTELPYAATTCVDPEGLEPSVSALQVRCFSHSNCGPSGACATVTGFEPAQPTSTGWCSTVELHSPCSPPRIRTSTLASRGRCPTVGPGEIVPTPQGLNLLPPGLHAGALPDELGVVVVPTGLEPASARLKGGRLSPVSRRDYGTFSCQGALWLGVLDSNQHRPVPKSGDLPVSPTPSGPLRIRTETGLLLRQVPLPIGLENLGRCSSVVLFSVGRTVESRNSFVLPVRFERTLSAT